jgi:hypothetical protein
MAAKNQLHLWLDEEGKVQSSSFLKNTLSNIKFVDDDILVEHGVVLHEDEASMSGKLEQPPTDNNMYQTIRDCLEVMKRDHDEIVCENATLTECLAGLDNFSSYQFLLQQQVSIAAMLATCQQSMNIAAQLSGHTECQKALQISVAKSYAEILRTGSELEAQIEAVRRQREPLCNRLAQLAIKNSQLTRYLELLSNIMATAIRQRQC